MFPAEDVADVDAHEEDNGVSEAKLPPLALLDGGVFSWRKVAFFLAGIADDQQSVNNKDRRDRHHITIRSHQAKKI